MAIPTTAGTGAEATRNAVIGFPEKQFKASIRSELLLPRVALIDPELGVDVPPHVTAASGMDALCQLIESYTSTGANPMTDALAHARASRLAARHSAGRVADGADLDAREDMAMAALLSGVTLDQRRPRCRPRVRRAARRELPGAARRRLRRAAAARDRAPTSQRSRRSSRDHPRWPATRPSGGCSPDDPDS